MTYWWVLSKIYNIYSRIIGKAYDFRPEVELSKPVHGHFRGIKLKVCIMTQVGRDLWNNSCPLECRVSFNVFIYLLFAVSPIILVLLDKRNISCTFRWTARTVERIPVPAVIRGAFSTKITLNGRGGGKNRMLFRPSRCCRTRCAVKGSLRYLNFSGKDTRVRAAAAMTMLDRPRARWKSHRSGGAIAHLRPTYTRRLVYIIVCRTLRDWHSSTTIILSTWLP